MTHVTHTTDRQCPACHRTVPYNGPACADCQRLVHRKCAGTHRCPRKAERIARLDAERAKLVAKALPADLLRLLAEHGAEHFDAGEWNRDESDESWDDVYARVLNVDRRLQDRLIPLARDAAALDRIHAHLDGREWSADDLDAIAEMLTATGRTIRPPRRRRRP